MRKSASSAIACGRSGLLLSCATAAVLSAMSQAAWAQDNGAQAVTDEPVTCDSTDPNCAAADRVTAENNNPADKGIVVTGSRIVKKDFEANSPILTVDQTLLQNSATAALESNLNKLPQFVPAQTPTAGGDIQPTATNTPGAATISLRGIGANRNLVLIDSRRATPSNASGVVDISTIPSAAIERIETISGGASATYGADAVAGVTNFILKKNFQGLELDGQAGLSQEGDGFEYQLSGIMGTDFADGRGNISFAMSTNKRDAVYQRNRSWYRNLWADPEVSATQFFVDTPGVYFGYANLPDYNTLSSMFPNSSLPSSGYSVYTNTDGSAYVNGSWYNNGVYTSYLEGFDQSKIDGYTYKVTDAGTLGKNNTDNYLILPLTRYNFFARGNYEINDWINVFGQALYSHVKTSTLQEPGPITSGWSVAIDPTTLDRDQLPADLWTLLDSRADPDAPFELRAILPDNRKVYNTVSTYNMVAGLQGSIPGSDWTWDMSVNHGESETFTLTTGVYSLERLRTVLNSGNFGKGFTVTGNAKDGGFGASTATCTSGLNFFLLDSSEISQDCLDAIKADLKNRSTVRQTIWEANATGTLFQLPAGPLQAAIGATYREQSYHFINDTITDQGTSFQDQALGIYPSADASGSTNVKELYAELAVPVLRDVPFIKAFNLELGGRISDYNTTGTSYTYKALGDWEVNDWLRFRGGYNRAERSPNIGELYLSAQETFGANYAGDPCSVANPLSWSANPANATGNQVRAVCEVLMAQSGDPTAATTYYNTAQSSSTFGYAWPILVGNPNLKPEQADTWTAGFVIKSPFAAPALSRLKLSVDWFDIKVNHAIAPLSVAAALELCLDPAFNPLVLTDATAAANTQYCQNIKRNQTGQQGTVYITYTNSGRFDVEGIDTQLDWGMDVGPGSLGVNVALSYLIHYKSAALSNLPMVDYAGTFGTTENGLNSGAYRYRVLTTINYTVGKLGLGLQWQHLPAVEDSTEATTATTTVGAPAYDLFNLNANYALTDNVKLRFGVDNLFNRAPPLTNYDPANTSAATTGLLIGGGYTSTYYDTNGRRFYVGANLRF